jgi:chemotaxis protein CheD
MIQVELADMKVSNRKNEMIGADSLGACIGLAVYDPVVKVGGLLHYMLPISKIDPQRARTMPAMFADTGSLELFKALYALGGKKERLQVRVVGGSQLMGNSQLFDMGKRNYLVLRKIFAKNNIKIHAEDIGGHYSRSIRMDLNSGECIVKANGRENQL